MKFLHHGWKKFWKYGSSKCSESIWFCYNFFTMVNEIFQIWHSGNIWIYMNLMWFLHHGWRKFWIVAFPNSVKLYDFWRIYKNIYFRIFSYFYINIPYRTRIGQSLFDRKHYLPNLFSIQKIHFGDNSTEILNWCRKFCLPKNVVPRNFFRQIFVRWGIRSHLVLCHTMVILRGMAYLIKQN